MSKGGGSSSAQPQTTNTSMSGPWSGQQPYLLQGFNQAQNLFNQGGQQYYPGQTYAGPTSAQLQGLQNEANLGLTGTTAQNAANPALQNILSSNWLSANPSNPYYQNAAQGGMNVNTGGLYAPLATGQETNTMGLPGIADIASGWNSNRAGQPTLNAFASGMFTDAGNPYFQQMANTTAANVLPQIQSQFSGANRLDSGLASRAASQGLGDAIGGLAYQNYQQGLQQQQSAAEALGQLGASNLGAQLQAGGLLSNIGQQNIGNQLAASNALTQLGLSNVGTQLSGAQGLGNAFNAAAQNQLSALGQAPNIGNMDYQQVAALLNSGQGTQQLNQAAINDAVARWNAGQQQPYQNLSNYMQAIQGSYGSQGASSQPYSPNSMANTMGGLLGGYGLGSSLFGSGSGGYTMGGTGGAFGSAGGVPILNAPIGGSGSNFLNSIGNMGSSAYNWLSNIF